MLAVLSAPVGGFSAMSVGNRADSIPPRDTRTGQRPPTKMAKSPFLRLFPAYMVRFPVVQSSVFRGHDPRLVADSARRFDEHSFPLSNGDVNKSKVVPFHGIRRSWQESAV
jgi:hypothetical protein